MELGAQRWWVHLVCLGSGREGGERGKGKRERRNRGKRRRKKSGEGHTVTKVGKAPGEVILQVQGRL